MLHSSLVRPFVVVVPAVVVPAVDNLGDVTLDCCGVNESCASENGSSK